MPASWPRSADRSQSAAPLPADSSPPRTLLVEPARIAPHPSSLRPPLPITRQMGYLLPDFYSGATGLSGYFTEGFSLRRSHRCHHHAAGVSLRVRSESLRAGLWERIEPVSSLK